MLLYFKLCRHNQPEPSTHARTHTYARAHTHTMLTRITAPHMLKMQGKCLQLIIALHKI